MGGCNVFLAFYVIFNIYRNKFFFLDFYSSHFMFSSLFTTPTSRFGPKARTGSALVV